MRGEYHLRIGQKECNVSGAIVPLLTEVFLILWKTTLFGSYNLIIIKIHTLRVGFEDRNREKPDLRNGVEKVTFGSLVSGHV